MHSPYRRSCVAQLLELFVGRADMGSSVSAREPVYWCSYHADGVTQLSQQPHQHRRPQQLDPVRESKRLLEEERHKDAAKQLRAMQEVRRKLPAFAQRAGVLDTLRRHSVLVVSGATGEIAKQTVQISPTTKNGSCGRGRSNPSWELHGLMAMCGC